MKHKLNNQTMKSGKIIVIVIFFFIITGTAGANNYPKAISDNDTMLIIVNRNLEFADLNSFCKSPVQNIIYTAVPDTIRDIIIIFRNYDWKYNNIKIVEGKIQQRAEMSMIKKTYVSNICKEYESL